MAFKEVNPLAVEPCVWSANGTDEVVTFCVEVPKGGKTKNDVSALELLELVKLTQENWVMAGRVKERCAAPHVMHNVSNTITIRQEEWESVTKYIYDNRNCFAGVTLLPISGDKDYPQAPFTAIYQPHEIVKMYGNGSLMASGLIVDGLHAFNNNLWSACDAALDRGTPLVKPEEELYGVQVTPVVRLSDAKKFKEDLAIYEAKADWVRRAKQFAERYFEGDVKNMTWCLKDVNNWKQWLDLTREYKDVDYTMMIEEADETKLMQEAACVGGQCSLSYA